MFSATKVTSWLSRSIYLDVSCDGNVLLSTPSNTPFSTPPKIYIELISGATYLGIMYVYTFIHTRRLFDLRSDYRVCWCLYIHNVQGIACLFFENLLKMLYFLMSENGWANENKNNKRTICEHERWSVLNVWQDFEFENKLMKIECKHKKQSLKCQLSELMRAVIPI